MTRYPPELLVRAWDFMSRREQAVRKLCRRMVRGRSQVSFDEAMSECALRAPMAIAAWREDGGATLDTHVLNTLRWYLYKLTRTRVATEIDRQRALEGVAPSAEYVEDRRGDEDAEWVHSLLSRLPTHEADVLRMRFVEGLSLDEVAERLGRGRSTAHLAVNTALSNARRTASGEEP